MSDQHSDLRKQAVSGISAYMHHRLFDVIPVNLMGFMNAQADELMSICDRAIEKAIVEGKRQGLIS